MIYIKYCQDEVRLQVRGHAGYAPEGQDIVCAGISTLFGTLKKHALVQELPQEGDWYILKAQEGTEGIMRPYFDMIAEGMQDIAQQYPGYIMMGIRYVK